MTDFHTAHLLENLGRAVKMYDASLSIRIPTWPKLLWQIQIDFEAEVGAHGFSKLTTQRVRIIHNNLTSKFKLKLEKPN